MKTVFILCIVAIFSISCNTYKKSETWQQKGKYENFISKSKDTLTVEITTFCFQKQNICFDTFAKKIVCKSNDLLDVLDNDILDTFVYRYDTLNLLPVNIRSGENTVVDQFFNLFRILGYIKNDVFNKDYSINYFDSLAVKTSSFFDLNIKTPVVLHDTMKYDYEYYKGKKIFKGSTNLIVELKIDRLEDGNLNYLKIRHDTIRQNDFVIHRYKSVNDFCREFDFTLSFKTNDKNITNWSSIFDFDEWILEYFKYPQEKMKKE